MYRTVHCIKKKLFRTKIKYSNNKEKVKLIYSKRKNNSKSLKESKKCQNNYKMINDEFLLILIFLTF